MTTRCAGCRHPGRTEARYCPHCGLPVLEGDAGTVETSTTHESATAGAGGRIGWLVLAALALALAGLLGWRSLDVGAGSGGDEPTDAARAAGPSGSEFTAETGDGAAADADPSVTQSPAPPPGEVELTELDVDAIPDRDDLAALNGHYLFVSHSQGLLRLDTDTGAVDEYERSGRPGMVLGRYRDRLIMVEEQTRMVAVSAERPGDPASLLFDLAPAAIMEARMLDGDRMAVMVSRPTEPQHSRVVVDLGSGELVDVSTRHWWQANDLTWVPGGGLFEATESGHRFLSTGFPIVAGTRHVLVRACSGPEVCDERWIDRRSGERVDRAVPAGEHWNLQSVGDDDRILFVDDEDGHRYFDAENGWYLPGNVARGTAGGFVEHPPEIVVGDGRYLITPTVPGIVIYDLDGHDAFVLDFGPVELRGVTALVAVPKPDRWGAS